MKYIFTIVICCILIIPKSAAQNAIIDNLFFSSYKVYDNLRYPNGIYRAKLPLSGSTNTFAAISVTGMGLVSLCIADTMHWTNNAKDQALQTIKTLLGYSPGFKPFRNPAGFYFQYLDPLTGENPDAAPFSTIDNAVLVSGILFCKNYFQDDSITYYADKLWKSYKWAAVIADADNAKLFLTLDSIGNGKGNPTRLYNEYIQVAWLAKGQECSNLQDGPASKLWFKFCDNPDNFPVKPVYQGVEMIGVFANTYQPEHVMGMPHYLCHHHTVSKKYAYYMNNMRKADSLWWVTTKLTKPYEWGMSAGSGISKSYRVDAINDNVDTIVSPHALASFIPVFIKAKTDLINLYKNNKGVYALPADTSLKIVWRYSPAHPQWKADVVQGVDFATLLFGLAALPEKLGIDFFAKNNDFFSPQAKIAYTPANVCEGMCIQFKNNSPSTGGTWKWTFQAASIPGSTLQNPQDVCYNLPGTYTVTLLDSNRCSAKLREETIVIHALPEKPAVTQNKNQLQSTKGLIYQWYFNNAIIPGATKQNITITQNGSYSVCIQDGNNCQACSDPFIAVINTIHTADSDQEVALFPNPAQDNVTLSWPSAKGKMDIKLINARGQCVRTAEWYANQPDFSYQFDLSGITSGLYSFLFQNGEEVLLKRLIIKKN